MFSALALKKQIVKGDYALMRTRGGCMKVAIKKKVGNKTENGNFILVGHLILGEFYNSPRSWTTVISRTVKFCGGLFYTCH